MCGAWAAVACVCVCVSARGVSVCMWRLNPVVCRCVVLRDAILRVVWYVVCVFLSGLVCLCMCVCLCVSVYGCGCVVV